MGSLYWGPPILGNYHIGIMEKKMETTGIIGFMWGYIGSMGVPNSWPHGHQSGSGHCTKCMGSRPPSRSSMLLTTTSRTAGIVPCAFMELALVACLLMLLARFVRGACPKAACQTNAQPSSTSSLFRTVSLGREGVKEPDAAKTEGFDDPALLPVGADDCHFSYYCYDT